MTVKFAYGETASFFSKYIKIDKKMRRLKAVHRFQQGLVRLRVGHHKVKLGEARSFVAGRTCKIQRRKIFFQIKTKSYVFILKPL